MQRINNATDDFFRAELLDIGGNRKRGFEVLTDRKDHCIAGIDGNLMERIYIRAVRLNEKFDFVFQLVDVCGIVVYGNNLMSFTAELTREVGAESSKAYNTESHNVSEVN